MSNVPYSSAVGSLMYAQVCTRPDFSFIEDVVSKFLSEPRHAHMGCLLLIRLRGIFQRTTEHMFVYREIDNLNVIGPFYKTLVEYLNV